jgi:hypothetical protein
MIITKIKKDIDGGYRVEIDGHPYIGKLADYFQAEAVAVAIRNAYAQGHDDRAEMVRRSLGITD